MAGVWEDSDGGEITSVSVDPHTDVLACGDEYGRLKLYNFPCTSGGDLNLTFRGHAGPISWVRFSEGGHYLYSTGKDDCCIFQWKHELGLMEEDEENTPPKDLSSKTGTLTGHMR